MDPQNIPTVSPQPASTRGCTRICCPPPRSLLGATWVCHLGYIGLASGPSFVPEVGWWTLAVKLRVRIEGTRILPTFSLLPPNRSSPESIFLAHPPRFPQHAHAQLRKMATSRTVDAHQRCSLRARRSGLWMRSTRTGRLCGVDDVLHCSAEIGSEPRHCPC